MPYAPHQTREPDCVVGRDAVAVEGTLRLQPRDRPDGMRSGAVRAIAAGRDETGWFGDLRQNLTNRWMVQQR